MRGSGIGDRGSEIGDRGSGIGDRGSEPSHFLFRCRPLQLSSSVCAEAVAHDTVALRTLCERMVSVTSDVASVLSRCVSLTEAQHDTWQATVEQVALMEQLMSARRLAHRLNLAVESKSN